MPHKVLRKKETNHIKEWFNSHFQEIQEDHGGKFIAVIEPGKILVKDRYIDLLQELEKKEVDLESVAISNVPRGKEYR